MIRSSRRLFVEEIHDRPDERAGRTPRAGNVVTTFDDI